MKALSVRQPWAGQIARGEKWEEYRTRPTRHRGELLICAGRTWGGEKPPDWNGLARGHAICVVDVIACDDDGAGGYAWVLDNVRPVWLFPVKGRLGLFEVPRSRITIRGDRCQCNPEGDAARARDRAAAGKPRAKPLPFDPADPRVRTYKF